MSFIESKSFTNPYLKMKNSPDLEDLESFAQSAGDNSIVAEKTQKGYTVLFTEKPIEPPGEDHAKKEELAKKKITKLIDQYVSAEALEQIVAKLNEAKPLSGTNLAPILIDVTQIAQEERRQAEEEAALEMAAMRSQNDTSVASMETDNESKPISDRPQINLVMGQGAIGRMDQFKLYSDSFSTCMPVILYNQDTMIGGLFHVPSPGASRSDRDVDGVDEVYWARPLSDDVSKVFDALAEMIRLVKPTSIIVTPGAHGADTQERREEGATCNSNSVPPAARIAELVFEEVQEIAEKQGLDRVAEFRGDQLFASVMVTADSNGSLLLVKESIDPAGVLTLSPDNTLSGEGSAKALTWSFDF